VTPHRLSHAIWLAGFLALGFMSAVRAMPAPTGADTPLTVDDAPRIQLAQAQPAPSPSPSPSQAPDASAPADQPSAEEPIGNVASLTGVATVIRNKDSVALKLKDDIYLNDTVQTAASSSLGITFSDATTFHLSANAKITIDTYVYEENGGQNAGVFDVAKGTVAFVAASVAKTGSMQITTPTASLGIRGTTGVIDVPEGAAANTANNVNIKLYPDADGRVGRIEVNDRQGARLGALTQGASGFAIRPGAAGARFAAEPLTISPQQRSRDQGFVQQVHSTQTVGRQIVTERRDFRRANPTYVNPNAPRRQGTQPQQPGQTRPGQPQPGQNRPGQPGQPQQPVTPNNRQGQPQPGQTPRPGQTPQPGTTPRPGQTTPPTTPSQPGATPRSGQNTPATPAQPGATPRPGQTTTPTQPGATPRSGQNGQPTTPVQPGAAPRSGQTTPPATPAQPGAAPQRQSGPPPLPSGQPLLRQQPGRPQIAPGAPRTGFQKPAAQKPKPPPKDKKQSR
jgi:FecR protein